MQRHSNLVLRLVLGAGAVALIRACSSSDGNAVNENTETLTALPDELSILTLVYGAEVSKPSSFYRDPHADNAQPHTIHHVKNTDVGLPAPAPFELCTDDIGVALNWSEQDAIGRAVSGALLTTDENDRYYEFVRTLTGVGDWVSYGRVFKCAYLDRSGADASNVSGPGGYLNKPAFTPDDLRLMSEYFWTFSGFNNPGNAVLSGESFTSDDVYGYTLTLAILRRGAGTQPGCDAVDVADWEFTARPTDGFMEWNLVPVSSFEGRQQDGVTEVCNGN